ncbi:glycosyltransferase [Agromyces mariniharenae]|nr:glycosyltransferase [Agromyces mariniharenae]
MAGGTSDRQRQVATVADPSLPDGRQFAVTWGVPEPFGGMTSALLHRSRAFVRLAGREVDVVTFDPRPDLPAARERLARAGELIPGIRLRNLWEDLRGGPGGTAVATPRDDGASLVEHLRGDGSLAARDERFPAHAAGPSRRITTYDAGGAVLRQWTRAWDCYAEWLDGVVGDERAFAVTDSKTAAEFMARYRRPNVVSLHLVHNSHLVGPDRPWGMLRPSRRRVFAHLERFDGVVFLTERQRADAATLLGDPGNLTVVPNGIDPLDGDPAPDAERDPAAGVVLARLTTRKRVDHAIEVVRRCRDRGVPVTLTVYGDGPDAPALRRRVDDAGLGDAVTFAGHRSGAADAFADASWTLVTSTFEGSPLALAEAMARGCLPIAYDIPYGPADLIADGVDGVLVADGDLDAAADAVARLVALPAPERERMRRAARATAARHDDAHVVEAWGRVQRAAAARHGRTSPPLHVELERLRMRFRRRRLRVSVRLRGVPPGASVTITLRRRGRGALVRERRPARDGRTMWRLGERASRLVGGRHPLTCIVEVEHLGAVVEAGRVTAHPDTRSVPRRAAQRVLGRFGRRRR